MLFEVVLPADYIAGRDLTLTVGAQVAGAGTLGATKTLTLTAYRVANDGTHGANLGPAVVVLAAPAGDYAFAITGAGLAPGERVFCRLVMAIQETAGTQLNGRINSARLS